MAVWYCTPSARPKEEAEACFSKWLEFGCKVIIMREGPALELPIVQYPVSFYSGYPISCNTLIKMARVIDQSAEWFILGGDDYYPDMRLKANEVADECDAHFGGTFGVMQPTGDRYGNGYIDTAAASPWIGKEFCNRAYSGYGPLHAGYHHLYADTELQAVAQLHGVFWQRLDIKQEHKHWSRYGNVKPDYADGLYAGSQIDQSLYEFRKEQDFPGSL